WLGAGSMLLAQEPVQTIPAQPLPGGNNGRIILQAPAGQPMLGGGNVRVRMQEPAAQPTLPGAPSNVGQPAEGLPDVGQSEGAEAEAEAPLGPTPLLKVGILNNLLYGDQADKAKIKFAGWADFDYTYRSTGHGINSIAPVMNRFGDEFLT